MKAKEGTRSVVPGAQNVSSDALIGCGVWAGQKLDCSRVTLRGHAPSSWVKAGGAVPESHVGSQARPVPRPLPRRENRVERELATGDFGDEVTWGGGSDGGGGAGGRGSPPESKFPPGEDKWETRMTNFESWDSIPSSLSSQSQVSKSLTSLFPKTWSPGPQSTPTWNLGLPSPVQLSSSRQTIASGPQILPDQDL